MITCESCKYENNPPQESKCLYCGVKLGTVKVVNEPKYRMETIQEAVDFVKKCRADGEKIEIGDVVATQFGVKVYYDKWRIILNFNPQKFKERYFTAKWFSVTSNVDGYFIENVAQTREDIILVFLRPLTM